jgi:hypothetical protein
MLAPGESLTGRVAKIRQGGRRRSPETEPASPAVDQPTGAYQPSALQPAGSGFQPAAFQAGQPGQHGQPGQAGQHGQPAGGNTTSVIPPRDQWNGARAAAGGTVVVGAGARRRALVDNAVQTARRTADQVVTTVRGWPRNTQLAAAGGLAAVLVLGLFFALSGGDDKTPAPVAASQPSAAPPSEAPPALPTQAHSAKGILVQVPKDWKRNTSGGVWIDYVDPDDSLRKVRILVEKSNGTPTSFLTSAEGNLKKKTASCPKPYARVDLKSATLDSREGAILEYTCGEGDDARHGIWGAVVVSGRAYEFYLTTKASRFDESRGVFDEMVKTFDLPSLG